MFILLKTDSDPQTSASFIVQIPLQITIRYFRLKLIFRPILFYQRDFKFGLCKILLTELSFFKRHIFVKYTFL